MFKQDSPVLQSLTGQCKDSKGEEDQNNRKRKFSSLTSSNDRAESGSASTDSTILKEPSVGEALITTSPPENIKGTDNPQSGTSFNGKP